ncbi:MAG TPA: chloride channel protein [Tepidisphaeraceae bacterium]|nr:chloride channel protein [Tepidisphaeraceae bacterium]
MAEHEIERASTTEGLPVSPSLGPALSLTHVPKESTLVNGRVVFICALAIVLAIAAGFVAQILMHLIWFITNLAFHGKVSFEYGTPMGNHLGLWVLFVPVIGGVIVGVMARYGSKAIRGHGIPEAMEQVLLNQSKIPARLTFLKPISAAFAIGTGGPFGAEGPIIATGGALGSLIGQVIRTTASERKTLLAAGAAAGMAATFGSPVSAVLLAIELLLFEYRPRSIIPVALAASSAAGVRAWFDGTAPVFAMPNLQQPTGEALAIYILLGAVIGLAAVIVTRIVYWVEDSFEHLPVHWMWWPAIGAIAVGVIGYKFPATLGVGYYNISHILSIGDASLPQSFTISFVAMLCLMKFISWAISLGSGTSGGTLAPLFTIGGGLGAVLGSMVGKIFPTARVDIRIAALVGMASIFAGASRALLASAVFAFETTLQPLGLLPLLGGCTASFLVSSLLMRNTIMTEKIARRGVRVPAEYEADFLEQCVVSEVALKRVVMLRSNQFVRDVRVWLQSGETGSMHQGFPVIDENDVLVGVLTRRVLLDMTVNGDKTLDQLITMPPKFVYPDLTLRDAADHMVNHDIGRLPVVTREAPHRVIGMLTRSDNLGAHRKRLREEQHSHKSFRFPWRSNGEVSKR